MTTLEMKLAIDDYERAVATLKWLDEYDNAPGAQGQELIIMAKVIASSTPGAKETQEVLAKVAPGAALTIRRAAIDWCNAVIAAFPAKMSNLAAEEARNRAT